jgi:hypothetical protein
VLTEHGCKIAPRTYYALTDLGWIDWFNHTRLYEALDYQTPAVVEAEYRSTQAPAEHQLAGQLTTH